VIISGSCMRPFAEIHPRSVRDPGSADALGALAAMEFCRDLGLPDIILD
jgi:hypothetical protein